MDSQHWRGNVKLLKEGEAEMCLFKVGHNHCGTYRKFHSHHIHPVIAQDAQNEHLEEHISGSVQRK